jgi:hypothetical protein
MPASVASLHQTSGEVKDVDVVAPRARIARIDGPWPDVAGTAG